MCHGSSKNNEPGVRRGPPPGSTCQAAAKGPEHERLEQQSLAGRRTRRERREEAAETQLGEDGGLSGDSGA